MWLPPTQISRNLIWEAQLRDCRLRLPSVTFLFSPQHSVFALNKMVTNWKNLVGGVVSNFFKPLNWCRGEIKWMNLKLSVRSSEKVAEPLHNALSRVLYNKHPAQRAIRTLSFCLTTQESSWMRSEVNIQIRTFTGHDQQRSFTETR